MALIGLGLQATAHASADQWPFDFPEQGDIRAQAVFCLATQRAVAAAMSLAATRQDDHQTPVRIAGLSVQGLARVGGEAGLATINRLAAEMRLAWESYAETHLMPLRAVEPDAMTVKPAGMPLAVAQERCWKWAETLPFPLHDPDRYEHVDAESTA
jgi:hypothetical protein